MKRREFITLLGIAAAAWPMTAQAQPSGRIARVGVLMSYTKGDPEGQARFAAIKDGLKLLGWIEGRNLRIDYRWGALSAASTQQFAIELIALRPDLILSQNTPTTTALLKQTRTLPVVFAVATDPVGSGFVRSLSRPGGNATGFINMEGTIAGKWVELLKEIAPRTSSVAFLYNPTTASFAESYLKPFNVAAKSFAVKPIVAPVRDLPELESVIAAQAHEANSGLIVMPEAFTIAHHAVITSLAARYRLPTVYPYRYFVESGGLLSYGNDIIDNYRRAATYVDRILKGEKPGELPVQLPVKFQLLINLKTAKALGLNVPLQLQQRADEVIE